MRKRKSRLSHQEKGSYKDNEKKEIVDLLEEYADIFAWSYQDIPGLSTEIVEH